MEITKKYLNEYTYKVISCTIELHKHLWPGLLESVCNEWIPTIGFCRQLPMNNNWFFLNMITYVNFYVSMCLCGSKLLAVEPKIL